MSVGISAPTERLGYSRGAEESLAARIRAFRKARGWNQSQLAEACGITQSQVSRWEKDLDKPSTSALTAIANLADDGEKELWLEAAGVAQYVQQTPENTRIVPVLTDPAAAGSPRAIDEKNVETNLQLPTGWLPKGGKLYGIRVVGDSMSPTLEDGYIVIVNIAERMPEELVGTMVAAREGDGVTIKWLRKDGDLFFLVPQKTSERHPIRVLRGEGNWSIIGEVVKIIGDPPRTSKSRRK